MSSPWRTKIDGTLQCVAWINIVSHSPSHALVEFRAALVELRGTLVEFREAWGEWKL